MMEYYTAIKKGEEALYVLMGNGVHDLLQSNR